ncbi:hypothetical protein [Pelagovum pacificum]|uniref:Uncharacterized protein n=1 Tax=Pelagovum pacificum TaxID=2588711 RepID=A0A5C5GH10_9RHOB|nr:hypothetical protein [Pelagovum pacificum]QQA43616.1 hypothetical protein I8N54_03290 [Pelagovum pacificum]TNY33249.1 hypothetical protein FHY64_08240 [Pelagovum pacificum]
MTVDTVMLIALAASICVSLTIVVGGGAVKTGDTSASRVESAVALFAWNEASTDPGTARRPGAGY